MDYDPKAETCRVINYMIGMLGMLTLPREPKNREAISRRMVRAGDGSGEWRRVGVGNGTSLFSNVQERMKELKRKSPQFPPALSSVSFKPPP